MPTKYKTLTEELRAKIANEVKLMIFAHRDCLWNRFTAGLDDIDPRKVPLDTRDGYYGEAFGILRGLFLVGYGYFGSSNLDGTEELKGGNVPEHNLKWWMMELEQAALDEDGFADHTTSAEKTKGLLDKYRKLASSSR
jgi:hypothetical protein